MKTIKKLVYLLFLSGHLSLSQAEEVSDWVVEPASKSLCKGHYAPFTTGTTVVDNSWAFPIVLNANEISFTLEGQSHLAGDVTLQQGDRYLHADDIIINRSLLTHDWENIIAKNHIHYFSQGISIWGTYAEYEHNTQNFVMQETTYRWYTRHARGTAQQIEVDKDANVHLTSANYTTCAPFDHTWQLNAKELALSPKEGRATAKHIWLNLYKVPIFYFPYLNYPIDNKRHSGFLFPSYGSSSDSGNQIAIPYYWNIAPNYDFFLVERWLSERGLDSQSEFRYLFKNSEGILRWHFLPNDRKYKQFQEQNLQSVPVGLSPLDPRIIALEGSANRSALNYKHSSQWNRRWQFNVVFDYVSDDNYFVDLGNDINTNSIIHLPQKANLAYYGDYWTHFFNIEEYQVLEPLSKPINDEIYKRQPQWIFEAGFPILWHTFTFGLIGEAVNFEHQPELVTQQPVTTGQRFHLRPNVSVPLTGAWYTLTPRIQVDWLQYTLTLDNQALSQNLSNNPNRTIPLYDFDAELFFEKNIHYKQVSGIQTIEPRAYYLYVPYHNQASYPDFDSGIINFSYEQLFRDNRFSGRDRVGDTNQISLSLMTRFIPDHTGQEIFRASLGQIFYFENRRVMLCEALGRQVACPEYEDETATAHHSNLIGQAALHASPTWSGGFLWEWDMMHQVTEQAALSIQYKPEINKIFNLNYYWLKHDLGQINYETGAIGSLQQADAAMMWPIKLHWELISLWRYDLIKNQTVEILAGVEYNDCCLAFQLIGSRYRISNNPSYRDNPYATAVFVQMVFKGLSAIPLLGNPDSKLSQKIPGYVPLVARQQWTISPERTRFPPQEIGLY